MTPQAVLTELLDRVAAQQGKAVLLGTDELAQWPVEPVTTLKSQRVITKARPAASTVCPGCERECVMPVDTLYGTGRTPSAFVVCDKRSDINRVAVPISQLEQWQASGDSIADLLARLLGLHRSGADAASEDRWEVGVFKGAKHAGHLVLLASNRIALELAGHSIPLSEVLTFEGDSFKLDERALTRRVDHPVASAGDIESAVQRRVRLKKRIDELKGKGVKAFLKTVAEEEGISVSRVKQLLTEPKKTGLGW